MRFWLIITKMKTTLLIVRPLLGRWFCPQVHAVEIVLPPSENHDEEVGFDELLLLSME